MLDLTHVLTHQHEVQVFLTKTHLQNHLDISGSLHVQYRKIKIYSSLYRL